ncbi:MAG TPA: N-acetyltransferase [Asticcacaulis sp.]|nr:N-acetyltransferase [Asticcacaulis sp.]
MHAQAVTAADLSALSALATETFSETFGHLYPPEDLRAFLARHYTSEALAAEMAGDKQFWRMIRDDDSAAVAYVQCAPVGLPHPAARPDSEGEIKRLYVHSRAQGAGLGKQLMALALDHFAAQYGDAPQWIGVWSLNHRAQALYKSYGFEKVGEYQFPVGGTLDDEFILRRDPA